MMKLAKMAMVALFLAVTPSGSASAFTKEALLNALELHESNSTNPVGIAAVMYIQGIMETVHTLCDPFVDPVPGGAVEDKAGDLLRFLRFTRDSHPEDWAVEKSEHAFRAVHTWLILVHITGGEAATKVQCKDIFEAGGMVRQD